MPDELPGSFYHSSKSKEKQIYGHIGYTLTAEIIEHKSQNSSVSLRKAEIPVFIIQKPSSTQVNKVACRIEGNASTWFCLKGDRYRVNFEIDKDQVANNETIKLRIKYDLTNSKS